VIPSNILLLASIFVLLYFIGFSLTIYGLYQSIKDNKRFSVFISVILIVFYMLFGLALL
jgi:hypothetical protein